MLTYMEELCRRNEILQDSDLQQRGPQPAVDEQKDLVNPQPLALKIWDVQIPDNFKLSSMAMFDSKSDPHEHIIALNTQMV